MPDLPAKLILDIVAGVATFDSVLDLVPKLERIGYLHRGYGEELGGHVFVQESSPGIRTIHLHIVIYNGPKWIDYLRYRDLLRSDAEVRQRHAVLKRDLTSRYANDRKSYSASKHEFIQGILEAIPKR